MKQTESPLQTDLERSKTYLNKLWTCNHITTVIPEGPGGTVIYVRRDISLRGQTLILCVTAHNTWDIDLNSELVFIKFNKHGIRNDIFPLKYSSNSDLYYKFEGYDNYSLICFTGGETESYTLDIWEILIDQSEDMEIYSHPVNVCN